MKKILLSFLILVLLLNNNAYAYIGPGMGSIIIQSIIGTVAAGMSFIVLYWNKFKNFFKKSKKKNYLFKYRYFNKNKNIYESL